MGILDGIVEWIAEQVMHGLDLINTSVLGALGCDMSVFLRYFPAAETMYQVFVALAIGLILLLWVWNLFKNFGLGVGSEAEDPVKLSFRSILFIALAWYADDIVGIVLDIGGTPYDWILTSSLPSLDFASFNSVMLTIIGVCANGAVSHTDAQRTHDSSAKTDARTLHTSVASAHTQTHTASTFRGVGLGGALFARSLLTGGSFANDVIGTVARGDLRSTGSITGDLAAQSLQSYMGYTALSEGAKDVPTFSNVEIGGGRITGVETAPGSSEGLAFGMYHAGQYAAPQGEYTKVHSADGTLWYKQYAQDAVERKPYKAPDGAVSWQAHGRARRSPPERSVPPHSSYHDQYAG